MYVWSCNPEYCLTMMSAPKCMLEKAQSVQDIDLQYCSTYIYVNVPTVHYKAVADSGHIRPFYKRWSLSTLTCISHLL